MENKKSLPKLLIISDGILAISIVAMLFVINGIQGNINNRKEEFVNLRAFDSLNLQAKSVYIFDILKNKTIYEKNQSEQLPLASLTKLMTALTATRLLPMDSQITIKKEFLKEEGDTGLLAGENWKLKDLLDFSLITSSNDGARSIASVVGAMDLKLDDYNLGRKDFITKMNAVAKELGLNQTYYINESGLDEGEKNGGYSSAEDVAKLLQYILINKSELLEATKYPITTIDSLNKSHIAKNTNTELSQIPNLLASKTGYTDLAGGNLVVVFDLSIGHPIIAVVLGSTEKGRFSDIKQLVKASLDYVSQ